MADPWTLQGSACVAIIILQYKVITRTCIYMADPWTLRGSACVAIIIVQYKVITRTCIYMADPWTLQGSACVENTQFKNWNTLKRPL